MPTAPTVSAVIPTYNSAALLPRCIESVLNQTYPVAEILVVDDGSRDDTADVVSRYPEPVKLLQQKNSGVAVARNAGIQAATGDWVALLDADDRWLPEKTEVQLQCARTHPNAAVIYSDADVLLTDGTSIGRFLSDKGPASGQVFERLLESFFILPSTALVRRDALLECGGFNVTLRKMEDYDLWVRMARLHEFQLVPETLVLYERQPTSSSKDLVGMSRNQALFFKMLLLEDLSDRQAAKIRRRLAATLFDLAYELRTISPGESVSVAWESITTNPRRLRGWELWAKCLFSRLVHASR